jgi:hypothetical protein
MFAVEIVMLPLVIGLAGLTLGFAGAYELATGKSTGLLKFLGVRSDRIVGFDHGSLMMMAGGVLLAVVALG